MYTQLEAGVSAFCIPPHTPKVLRPYSITTYRVLVKSAMGRIAKCEVKQRTVPEQDWLRDLGQALDRLALFPEFTATQEKRKFEYAFNVSWLDEDIFDTSRWGCQDWVQSCVMDTVTSLNGAQYSDDFRPQLEAGITNHLSDCLTALKLDLDPLSMTLSSGPSGFKCALYNYFQDNNPQIVQARQQAIQSFPFLADRILLNSYADVRQAIDARIPLAPLLATRFKISIALLRRLSKFPFIQINDRIGKHINSPENLWPLFSNIPLDKVPNDTEQWAGFNSLIRRIYDLTKLPINLPLNRSILDQCLTNKDARKLFTGERWRDTQSALESLLAAWTQISRYVLRGSHSHTEADLRATGFQIAIIEKLGIPQLAKLAAQWDAAYQHAERVCEASGATSKTGHWPTILKQSLKLDTLVVVPLATAEALSAEGKRMDNCLASYAYSCQRGQAQLWSLRDEQGKSIANLRTKVVELEDGSPTIVIAELKGPENKTPSDEAVSSSQSLLEAIKAHPEELKQYLEWLTKVAPLSMPELTEARYVRPIIMAMKRTMTGKYDLTELFREMLGEGEDLKRLVIEN